MKKTSEQEPLNIKAIVGLAPFLDDEILDEIVSKVDTANVRDLIPLAPFLSDNTLTEISKKIVNHLVHSGNDKALSKFTMYI